MRPKIRCSTCAEFKSASAFCVDRSRPHGVGYHCRACKAQIYAAWAQTDAYDGARVVKNDQRRAKRLENPRLFWARQARAAAKLRAKRSGLPFDLDLTWLHDNAADVCPLLGIALRFDRHSSSDDSPALDRIDNTRGYTHDNAWVISNRANRIKNDATLAELQRVTRNLQARVDNSTPIGIIGINPADAPRAEGT